jgi:hypothetical protein
MTELAVAWFEVLFFAFSVGGGGVWGKLRKRLFPVGYVTTLAISKRSQAELHDLQTRDSKAWSLAKLDPLTSNYYAGEDQQRITRPEYLQHRMVGWWVNDGIGKELKDSSRGLLDWHFVTWVLERTIPTEWPPLVGEVSIYFREWRVPRGERGRSLRQSSRISRPEKLDTGQINPTHNPSCFANIRFSTVLAYMCRSFLDLLYRGETEEGHEKPQDVRYPGCDPKQTLF